MSRMPKNRTDYEMAMICAFTSGLNAGYGIEHTNIREEENEAIRNFAERNGFNTAAVEIYCGADMRKGGAE